MEEKNVFAPQACPSCGKQLYYQPGTQETACADCGARQEIETGEPVRLPIRSEADFDRPAEEMEVSSICPMQLTRAYAAQALKTYCKSNHLCPAGFRRKLKAEDLVGMYLPGWTFTAQTITKYTGSFGVDRVEKDKLGGKPKTLTDWYPAGGTYVEEKQDHLIWATEEFAPEVLEELQPYMTEDCRAFDPAYLAGFSLGKISVAIKDAWKKARTALEGEIAKNVRFRIISEKSAHHTKDLKLDIAYSDFSMQKILLPVWVYKTTWGKKEYTLLLNGETGRCAGKTPVSILRAVITGVIALGVLFLLLLWSKLGA